MATNYNKNLKTGKIRLLLKKNPNAGYNELKEILGKIDRSARNIYYQLHKEMFGTSGSLKNTNIQRKLSTKTLKIINYFKNNPNATIDDASQALHYRRHIIYGTITRLIKKGENITYNKKRRKRKESGKSLKICQYFKTNPEATAEQCSKDTKINKNYIIQTLYRKRKEGVM